MYFFQRRIPFVPNSGVELSLSISDGKQPFAQSWMGNALVGGGRYLQLGPVIADRYLCHMNGGRAIFQVDEADFLMHCRVRMVEGF